MRLTQHSDYALRVLMYLALAPQRRASVREIAEAFHISQNHLAKVAQRLVKAGMVESTPGRYGGLRLAADPTEVTLGGIVRASEDDLAIVECLGHTRYCRVAGVCGARQMFAEALKSFFDVLDSHTLDAVLRNRDGIRGALSIASAASSG